LVWGGSYIALVGYPRLVSCPSWLSHRVALPLPCEFIIPHLESFVKGYFELFFCFVVGIIQHFFSELALVHICIPQTYTPCGRVMGQRSYSLSWAPTFRGRLTLSFCTLIVSYFKGFVKRFYKFF
jgi:hypothetical protein